MGFWGALGIIRDILVALAQLLPEAIQAIKDEKTRELISQLSNAKTNEEKLSAAAAISRELYGNGPSS